MIVQVVRFTLPSSLTVSTASFLRLRQDVAAAGAIGQYFGYSSSLRGASIPKQRHEISWLIQWPGEPHLSERASLLDALHGLSQDDAVDLLVPFDDGRHDTLMAAFRAPICEIVVMRLVPDAPVTDLAFSASMHKAYTDCYRMQGFVGGDWGYASNTNDVGGRLMTDGVENELPREQQRLSVYCLGWESIELHEDASRTDVFAEEMDKLAPWLDSSSGAWYVAFRKHEG